jgi:hypothetical protein
MMLKRRLLFGGLYLVYGYSRLMGLGPFGRCRPAYLDQRPGKCVSETQPQNGNRLKTALHHQHVRQYHEASCSVASVATMLNAIRALNGRDVPAVTQADLLDRVHCGHWKQRMQPEGHRGRRGLPLKVLGAVTAASLKAYDIRPHQLAVVPTTARRAKVTRDLLRQRLIRFEERGDCLLLAHFNQGALVPALSIPHISPVGGYDRSADRVEILDVDPDLPTPYSVSFDCFYRALSCEYLGLLRPFGYRRGGYIYVKLASTRIGPL